MAKSSTAVAAAAAAVDKSDSPFKGVRRRKWGRWVSEIRLPNSRQRIWLGSYDSAHKAARAFDAALFCLRGSSARFNFPDDPPEIPRAGKLSREEIQSAAARFANNSDPPPSSECTPRAADSPSPSLVSDVTTAVCDERSPFLDLHTAGGPEREFGSDFGLFPHDYNPFFDEMFSGSFSSPCFDYGDENFDAIATNQDSFLWNF